MMRNIDLEALMQNAFVPSSQPPKPPYAVPALDLGEIN
jgi:hypothetical protein